jgi:hypothetical protein
VSSPSPLSSATRARGIIIGLRVSAIVETVAILGVLLGVDYVFGQGDRFFDMQPHPFWIVVLLVSAQYGLENGLFAAAAASAALLLFNIPPLAVGQDVIGQANMLAINPALWVVGAVTVGGLAERHLWRSKHALHSLEIVEAEADILRHSVERLAHANEALENRVAGQLSTFAGLYEAAKAVERETPGEVLMGAARLVRSALNAKEFSVFPFNEGVLEAALCEGWPANSRKARSYRAGMPLFDHVVAQRSFVHVAMPTGEVILDQQGVLAGPILNPSDGTVRGMLKVERLAFEDFTPSAVHNFRVLCEWLGAALVRAEDLQSARETSLMGEDGALLSRRLLSRVEDLFARLAKREKFPFSTLDLDIESASDEAHAAMPKLLSSAAAKTLRGTDLAFESRDGRGCCILLPGANEAEANAAATRFHLAVEGMLAQHQLEADLRVTVRLFSGTENAPAKIERRVA